MQVDAGDSGSKNVLPPTRTCLTQAGASVSKTFCHPRGVGIQYEEEPDPL